MLIKLIKWAFKFPFAVVNLVFEDEELCCFSADCDCHCEGD